MRLINGAIFFFIVSGFSTGVALEKPEIGAFYAGVAVVTFGLGLIGCALIAHGDK